MKIAEVSEQYGITTDTLRYYERIGLIPPVNRNGSGIRNYNELDLRRVDFIKCMRSAGLPVEVLVRQSNWQGVKVKVLTFKGLANRNDPNSCAVVSDDLGEALIGERAGQALSCENHDILQSADVFSTYGRQ